MPRCVLIAVSCLCLSAASGSGAPLNARWTYSTDGGKTFTDQAPMIPPSRVPDVKNTVTARATFTIDDPTKIGALKLLTHGTLGAICLTSARSVDRYNVGTRPTLTEAKFTLNGIPTMLGHLPSTLYHYLTIDPAELKKGPNTLQVTGVFWFTHVTTPLPGSLRFEPLSPDLAELDRHPVLGPVADDHFTFTARAVIPSTFDVTAEPLQPRGQPVTCKFPRTRLLKARVPLPKGTRRFRYSVTVKTGKGNKTYGPYEVTVPVAGQGLRFVVAGSTWEYKATRLEKWFATVARVKPHLYIHTGVYQNCAAWDFMWTNDFLRQARPVLSTTSFYPVCGVTEMLSPWSFARTFYFPPEDRDYGHWTSVIGPVRFVAIEAWSQSQSKDPATAAKWLDDVLTQAKEDYVIVLNFHVSGLGPGTRLTKAGVAHTTTHIDPILVKHKVTATVGAPGTIYARIEPPANAGVPTLVVGRSGGLGSTGHAIAAAKAATGYKASSGVGHYCLFEVKDDSLQMKAVDLDGRVIDTCTFSPRKR